MMANKPEDTNNPNDKDEIPYKSRYKWCHAWTHGAMRCMTKDWIVLNPRTNLFLDPSPLANIVAQTHNMIRVYGTYMKSKIKNLELGYEKLSKIFDKHLVQPKWYKEKYPDTEFSHREYLIRGHPEKKASNPAFVCRIINGVLSECSNIRLQKKNETASWLQILQKEADDGNYVVFFKVRPFEREQL